ncbi:MAG: hypothetical protein AB1601_04080 [Planctomycetota bacterium]
MRNRTTALRTGRLCTVPAYLRLVGVVLLAALSAPVWAQKAVSTQSNGRAAAAPGPMSPEQPAEPSPALWGADGAFAGRNPEDEVVELRGPSTKQFQNPDGTKTAVITLSPVHYRTATGAWQEIQPIIKPNDSGIHAGHPFAVTHHLFQAFFGASATDGYVVETEALRIEVSGASEIRVEGADGRVLARYSRSTARARVVDNRIDYQAAFTEIAADERLTVHCRGLKHEVIIRRPPRIIVADAQAAKLVFAEHIRLPLGGCLVETAGGSSSAIEVRDPVGDVAAMIPPTTTYEIGTAELRQDIVGATDADLSRPPSETRLRNVDGGYVLEAAIPLEWLLAPDRQYPVVIDPTINIAEAS